MSSARLGSMERSLSPAQPRSPLCSFLSQMQSRGFHKPGSQPCPDAVCYIPECFHPEVRGLCKRLQTDQGIDPKECVSHGENTALAQVGGERWQGLAARGSRAMQQCHLGIHCVPASSQPLIWFAQVGVIVPTLHASHDCSSQH